ncbi:MAG TPA: hypothetical protein VMV69_16920 [Pirellulales bacterium]|nr:hypothetical protein [Pirellulales bacterium]
MGHKQEIYWGRIWPHKLLAVSSVARRWVSAFRSLSQNPRLAFHESKGRLYRTWSHAEVYHLDGLDALARNLARRDEARRNRNAAGKK